MTWTKRKTIFVGAAIVLIGITSAVLMIPGFSEPSVSLPDGTEISIRKVSFGKTHRLVYGPFWRRIVAGMPTNITAALGVQSQSVTTKEDTLVIWLEWLSGTNKAPYPQWVRVIDSNGLASARVIVERAIYTSNNTMLATFHITNFPRRQKTLRIGLSAVHPTEARAHPEIAEFQIKNPGFTKSAPTRDLMPLSTTQVHGEQFTLLAINTGLHATGMLAANSLNTQWSELLFRIGTIEPAQRTTNARDRGDWSIGSIELRDGYGNFITERDQHGRIIPMGEGYMMRKDDGIALVRGAIWPGDIWKVRAEFKRTRTSSPDAAHRWTTSIRVPRSGEKIALNQTGRIEDCEIRLREIDATGSSPPMLHVDFVGKTRDHELSVLQVRDQRGSNIARLYRGRTKTTQRVELRAAPESTDLEVTFGVVHPLIVDLSGRPSILRTNVARWARQAE